MDDVKLNNDIAARALNRLENRPKSFFSVDQEPARVSTGRRKPSQTDSQSLRVGILIEKRGAKWRQGSLRLLKSRVKFSVSLLSGQRVT